MLHDNEFSSTKLTSSFNIGVCATMSSGKSTLLNAMLGIDALPFCHKACTARIISIEHDDKQDKLVGCRADKDGNLYYVESDKDVINCWNLDESTVDIFLVGRMVGIRSPNRIIRFYDTPGTNNSKDKSHERLTKEFLTKNSLDLLLYILDVEHIGTIDDANLLRWILENDATKNTKKIFIANKLDSLDNEKEPITVFLKHINGYLTSIGIESPFTLPLSASAARLFRMAYFGATFTKRDSQRFDAMYREFMEDSFDFRQYSDTHIDSVQKPLKGTVSVGNIVYEKANLMEAIERTGITLLEAIIMKQSEEDFL